LISRGGNTSVGRLGGSDRFSSGSAALVGPMPIPEKAMWGDKRCGRCGAMVSTTDQSGDACPRCGAPWKNEGTATGGDSAAGTSLRAPKSQQAGAKRALAWIVGSSVLVGGVAIYFKQKEQPRVQQAAERSQQIERRAEQMEDPAERIRQAEHRLAGQLEDAAEQMRQEKQRLAELLAQAQAKAALATGDRGVGRATAPQIVPGPAEVRGALDKEIIHRIVRRHINEVKYCYEQESSKKPNLAGRITVQFTIAASGQVIASVLQSSTVGNLKIENCVVQAVRRWGFPHPEGGGIVIVSYPFSFQPGN
jgi:TonB family protein